MRLQQERTRATDPHWLVGVVGIVADNADPDKQHRVKVTIPSIDPDIVFDEWTRQMVFSTLGDGFGAAFVPPVGSEVVLFGQLGEKYHLFYASLYNEELRVPDGYETEKNVGAKCPENLRFRADEIGRFDAKNVEINADELCKTTAQNAEEIIEQLHKTTAQNIESLAEALNKATGQSVQITADGQLQLAGGTITLNSNGSMTISASGNITVTATGNLTLQGRVVNKVGPPI